MRARFGVSDAAAEVGDRAEPCGLAHPGRTVSAEVAGDFTGAHGEADQDGVGQIEMVEQCGQVSGEGAVVVPDGGLAGAAEAASVAGDDPVPRVTARRQTRVIFGSAGVGPP
jgi:hypothetical protein